MYYLLFLFLLLLCFGSMTKWSSGIFFRGFQVLRGGFFGGFSWKKKKFQ